MTSLHNNVSNNTRQKPDMPRFVYALVILTAAVILATISYSTYLGNRAAYYFSPLLSATHEIKATTTLAHLWAEEVLMNDPKLSVNDVMEYYDQAQGYAAVMLEGGNIGNITVSGIDDPELRTDLKLTLEKIKYCRSITEDRFAMKTVSSVGTDIDQKFDLAFMDLLNSASLLESKFHRVMDHEMNIFHRIQYALLLSSFSLSFIVGLIVYRFNKKKTYYLLDTEEKNRKLFAMNQQLTAADQQLRAANQQLSASEQQLRASNHQLTASEQQLKASNQQLMASEQQLRASNQQLMASEQALRESETRYRSLFTDMAEGVALHRVLYDDNNRPVNYEIINVNPQYESILHLSREQVVGKTATEAYGVDIPPYITEYTRVAETGIPYRFETYFPPLKKHFTISVSSFEKGHFATIFADITKRKLAEEALRSNKARLEILWETSQYKAESIKDLLDYALHKTIELTGSKIGYIYHYNEDKKEFTLNSWSKDVMSECAVQEKQTTYQLDKTGIWGEAVRQKKPIIVNDYQAPHPLKKGCPEGHASLQRFMSIPVFSDSRIAAVVGVANKPEDYDEFDVKQLTLYMDSIWKLVEKQRSEEERLNLRLQMQRIESLGILAGGIAHDFNNLLTAILVNINLAAVQMQHNEKARKRLYDAERACVRSQALTQQLLTFASGGAPVTGAVRADELIRDSAWFSLRGSSVTAEINFPDDLWSIKADEGQINQVISNLTINAVQAMPEGGTVQFSAENVQVEKGPRLPLESGPYVHITVADQGIGIPEEYIQKIFDPYFTTKQTGSGLGLAVTYSIVNRHNGYITVTSGPGKGTIFSLHIPALPDHSQSDKTLKQEIREGKGTILLMDDEEMITKATGAVLREYGYTVALARNGEEALELYMNRRASEDPFDVVIMDLTIRGGMGGRETVQKLLQIDSDAKAIVSSGYSNDPVMANFRSYGFKGVITKPYKIDNMLSELQRIINE